jgi:Tripartite tricarboxylate transporter family receptor/Amidohydrolase
MQSLEWPNRVVRFVVPVALALLALLPARGHAADWPTRPIRWVVPFAAGGGNDIIARIMAPELSAALGQPVVIDNRPGAAGNVGSEMVARAVPDGYTWLIVATPNAVNESLYRHLGFSLPSDFAPVSLLMTMPNVLEVSNALPVRSVAELISYATAHPGKLNFGSGGSGSTPHMAGELFSYSDPGQIDRLAARHPKLAIIAAHGSWPWVNQILGIAYRRPNVWVSPDMYLFLPGWQMYVDAANGYLQDRFLFGTAYPALPFKATVDRFLELPFRDAVRPRLLHENAQRLLGNSTS